MECHKTFLILAVQLIVVIAKTSDTGPHTFTQSFSSAEFLPQRYGVKEVTMYLTPSQIQALQSGQASISQKPEDPNQYYFLKKGQESQTNLTPEQEAELEQNFQLAVEKLKSNAPQQTKPVKEQIDDIPPPPIKINNTTGEAQAYSYFHFNSETQPQNFKVEIIYPPQKRQNLYQDKKQSAEYEIVTDPLLKQKFKLVPYEYSSDDEVKAQLNQNIKTLQLPKQLSTQALLIQLRDKLQQQSLSQFKYAPQYSEQKHGDEFEKIIKGIREEKERAQAEILKIAKSPPVVVNKEIRIIKNHPVYKTKYISIPAPAPVLTSFPEHGTGISQLNPDYSLDSVNHSPYPIVKTEKVEVEKPLPYEIGKHIFLPAEKNAHSYTIVNKPYVYERIDEIKTDSSLLNIHKKIHYL